MSGQLLTCSLRASACAKPLQEEYIRSRSFSLGGNRWDTKGIKKGGHGRPGRSSILIDDSSCRRYRY
ncbi:hypothetical protein KRR38_33630 [Novosphingobium sp. G106]|uniref:hypothetical protein n=1 Tax=Novosphingobium sp. G106 TaxID=2849500 RepID=UPI001C2CECC5|nr:hypothetical protein [Novosphingobium sp. G106]MBV1692447.1 hypothetical protein [Novosphingobium sp. G106]